MWVQLKKDQIIEIQQVVLREEYFVNPDGLPKPSYCVYGLSKRVEFDTFDWDVYSDLYLIASFSRKNEALRVLNEWEYVLRNNNGE